MARALPLKGTQDLIVAPATASGAGAIAIVRMSGAGSHTAAKEIFSRSLESCNAGQLVLGWILNPTTGAKIDQVLAAYWRTPHSYTGEDMVEFHLHGSPAIVQSVLNICHLAGARLADPGEFTRRAFLNGKLDLAQAESVAELTRSRTDEARRTALAQLQGGLSARIAALRHSLIQVTAELEASVDYPEEEIPEADFDRIQSALQNSETELKQLVDSWQRGRLLGQGARLVFAGVPNAGKSSLFNAILRRERAIVSPHPGTTRDTLEAIIELNGIPVTLVDTAGLRAAAEEIEALGIHRTRQEIGVADLLLYVIDGAAPTPEALSEYQGVAEIPHLLVINKADICEARTIGDAVLSASIHSGERLGVVAASARGFPGIDALEAEILRALGDSASEGGDSVVITSSRHRDALETAREALTAGITAFQANVSPELVVLDLTTCLAHLDTITGESGLDEAVLDAIFSTFCLGK